MISIPSLMILAGLLLIRESLFLNGQTLFGNWKCSRNIIITEYVVQLLILKRIREKYEEI